MLDDLDATRAAYRALVDAGLHSADVGLAITQAAFDAEETIDQRTIPDTPWGQLLRVAGVYTGGVWMLVGGPLKNFAAAGSLIALLMNHGLNESDVAWLHDAIHVGRPMVAVQFYRERELQLARKVLSDFERASLMPSARERRGSSGSLPAHRTTASM